MTARHRPRKRFGQHFLADPGTITRIVAAIDPQPGETLVEIGLELKQRSPLPRTMVIGLANGRYGCLPTPKQHELGGYETWLGTCHVQEDASVIITDHLLEMLKELAAE